MQNLQPKSAKSFKAPTVFPFVIATVIGIGLLLFLLFSTTPDRVGPIGITGFFIILCLTLISLGVAIRNSLLSQPKSPSLLLVIIIPVTITGALALNTIELGIGDVVLLTLFVVTFAIYWTRLR